MLEHLNRQLEKPKRVVVIGSNGFVGSTILKQLHDQNIDNIGVSRSDVNLLSADASQNLRGILRDGDAIVFVSAIAPAKTARQLMDNLKMAENALEAFSAIELSHFVYISSDAVYADDANPVTEASPVSPSTYHGLMHFAREHIFRSEIKAPFAILRPTLIYGTRDPHSGYGPNRFRRQAMAGEEISLFGEGEEKRDHISVDDVARLVLLMLVNKSVGILNAVTGVSISFNHIAHHIAGCFQPPAKIVMIPRAVPRPHLLHRFFDITNCHRSFPEFSFETIERGVKRIHEEVIRK